MKIILATWKATRDEIITIENIAEYIRKEIIDSEIIVNDCYNKSIVDGDYYICLGMEALREHKDKIGSRIEIFSTLSIKDIIKDKPTAFSLLKEIIEEIKNRKDKKVFIETKEKISIGKELCDIVITEQEAEYLKTLKSLLDGSKVVIQKGDIRIEIE